MREAQFHAKDHAALAPSGAAILAKGAAMDDLLDRLQNGDPTLGWEGDPRLCLAYNRQTDRWELWRREADEQYRIVGMSRPGHGFPPNLIQNLMSRDGQRGYDIVKDMERQQQLRDRLREERLTETFRPRAEKFAWAIKKDLDL